MLTVPSSVNSSTALSLPPSVLAAVTSHDIVSTRVTQAGLPAPLSDGEVKNEAQGNGTIALPGNAPAASAGSPGLGLAGNLTGNLTASGPSATFVAQAFAQNDDAVALAISYAQFLPAPQYNTLVGYGFIKYKPSDAGIPEAPQPFTPVAARSASPSEYDAYSATQSRNAVNLSPAATQFLVAG